MLTLFRVLNVLILTLMPRIKGAAVAVFRRARIRDERGASAVDWLIITGVSIAIAYLAGDSVMAFARTLVGQLGR